MSNTIEYKFALLGDSSVGKTSIFRKISTGNFSEQNIATIGTDKRTINYTGLEVEMNGQKVNKSFEISLFDTAGQERFRSITKTYIKGSDGIILIYDITNRETFEHIESWLGSIKEILSDWKTSTYSIMLLGNKLDLIEDGDQKRMITTEESEKKCQNSGIMWGGECSAKSFTDTQFTELFKNLTIDIFSKVGDKKVSKQHSKKIGKYVKKRSLC